VADCDANHNNTVCWATAIARHAAYLCPMATAAIEAHILERYTTWHVGAGAVTVDVRPLGPAILRPELAIVWPNRIVQLPRRDLGETARFEIDDLQVSLLRHSPCAAPHLTFLCDAFLALGVPTRHWGWAMRIARADGAALPASSESGALALDDEGFLHTPLRPFAPGTAVARGHDIISLS